MEDIRKIIRRNIDEAKERIALLQDSIMKENYEITQGQQTCPHDGEWEEDVEYEWGGPGHVMKGRSCKICDFFESYPMPEFEITTTHD